MTKTTKKFNWVKFLKYFNVVVWFGGAITSFLYAAVVHGAIGSNGVSVTMILMGCACAFMGGAFAGMDVG